MFDRVIDRRLIVGTWFLVGRVYRRAAATNNLDLVVFFEWFFREN